MDYSDVDTDSTGEAVQKVQKVCICSSELTLASHLLRVGFGSEPRRSEMERTDR
jgi:hypothetical protein